MNDKEMFEHLVNENFTEEEVQEAEDETRLMAFKMMAERLEPDFRRKDVMARVPIHGEFHDLTEAEGAALCDALSQSFGWFQPRMIVESMAEMIEGNLEIVTGNHTPMNDDVLEDLLERLVNGSGAWREGNMACRFTALAVLYEMGLVPEDLAMAVMQSTAEDLLAKCADSPFAREANGGMHTPSSSVEAKAAVISHLMTIRDDLRELGIEWEDGALEDDEQLTEVMEQIARAYRQEEE